jgi:tetratricopeptide (TPR) repeat protein
MKNHYNPRFKLFFYSLNEKDQKALCKLSVFPGTFYSQAAVRISEQNADTLQTLLQSGLIKNDLLSKRYIIHSWIKEQLKDYIPEIDLREARIRHAIFYLSIFDTAGESFFKGGEKVIEGLKLFHHEWENICCGLSRMHKGSVEGKKSAELFSSYMRVGSQLLRFRFFQKECREFLEAGLKISQRLGTEDIETCHLLNLGTFLNSIYKYEDAKECLDQAMQLAEKLENAQVECQIINELAIYYLATKKPDEAIQSLIKKQNLERLNKFEIEPESGWTRLGLAYEQKSEFENAVAALKEGSNKAFYCRSTVFLQGLFLLLMLEFIFNSHTPEA